MLADVHEVKKPRAKRKKTKQKDTGVVSKAQSKAKKLSSQEATRDQPRAEASSKEQGWFASKSKGKEQAEEAQTVVEKEGQETKG